MSNSSLTKPTTIIGFKSRSLVAALMLPVVLVGCGGGGGGPVSQALTPVPRTLADYDYTVGTASNDTAAKAALNSSAMMGNPYTSLDTMTSYASASAANATLNGTDLPIAARDTNADDAWALGWTGHGVNIGVMDSFDVDADIDEHGEYVSLVVHSIAPEATIYTYDMNQALDDAWAYFDSVDAHIINHSFGVERISYISDDAWNSDINILANNYIADHPNGASPNDRMLYVWAAGNNAALCGPQIQKCDLIAAVYDELNDRGHPEALEDTIFVGALADGTNTIAGYSYQAGDLANHFMVAHDDVLTEGDAAGTSFAAPRVAAAAAIVRHKFPSLDGVALKQVMLQTAEDLGATGPDAVYGYGKLDLMNALSPQGQVYVD